MAWNRSKEADVEKERLKERLSAYAKKEGMETIVGSDFCVKVTFKENQKLPENNLPDRLALEKVIKDAGLWNEASRLDGNTLAKIVESNKWDKELIDRIKQFASEEESVTVNKPKVIKREE